MTRARYNPLTLPRGCRLRRRRRGGFSLIEGVVAMLVLLVLVTATVGYSSYSARQVYKAQAQETAGRLARLLLEGCKGSPDPSSYDPVDQFSDDLEISRVRFSFQTMGLFLALSWSSHLLGVYEVDTPQATYYLALSREPADADTPEQYQVQMIWRSDLRDDSYWTSWEHFGLTTYAQG